MPRKNRLAYLRAMQIDYWKPRSLVSEVNSELYLDDKKDSAVLNSNEIVAETSTVATVRSQSPTFKIISSPKNKQASIILNEKSLDEAMPRFSLQLIKAGDCIVLFDLPTREALHTRDPEMRLLRDLLLSAKQKDSIQPIAEPIYWPLLTTKSIYQGMSAAIEFVQSFVAMQLTYVEFKYLWLIGSSSAQYMGISDAKYTASMPINSLNTSALILPGFDQLLMDSQYKVLAWESIKEFIQINEIELLR